jgi:hypothetical protein
MINLFEKLYRAFLLMTVCGAVGALINFLIFVAPFLVLGGLRSEEWLHDYGSHNGTYFVCVTVLLGVLVFPFVRKLRTS